MRTDVPEKLLEIADDIAAHGNANLTRLTGLKKWFARLGSSASSMTERATTPVGLPPRVAHHRKGLS